MPPNQNIGLLVICFLREAPETAVGLDRLAGRSLGEDWRAGKWGLRGKRGRKRCFSEPMGGVSVRKIPIRHLVLAGVRGFTAKFISREHSFPNRFAKKVFGSGCFLTDGRRQVYSRTRVRPSSKWTTGACQVGL